MRTDYPFSIAKIGRGAYTVTAKQATALVQRTPDGWRWTRAEDQSVGGEWRRTAKVAIDDFAAWLLTLDAVVIEEIKPDFLVEDHGSIFILQPLTPAAREWVSEHIPDDAQWWAGGVAVEHRYIGAIVDGAIGDGLVVR